MIPLTFFVSLLFLYSLLSGRLERTIVTAPIVFTVAGMLMFSALQGILRAGFTAKAGLHIAEVGLVMLLFTDASRTDLARIDERAPPRHLPQAFYHQEL